MDLRERLEQALEHDDLTTFTSITQNVNIDPGFWLRIAISDKAIDIVEYLVNNYRVETGQLYELLEVTSERGNLPLVEILVQALKKKESTPYLNTALLSASTRGKLDVAKYLIANGANSIVEAMNAALHNSKLDIIEYLLQNYSFADGDLDEFIAVAGQRVMIKASELLLEAKQNQKVLPTIKHLAQLSEQQRYAELLTISVDSVLSICKSGQFPEICLQPEFWATRAEHDFNFAPDIFLQRLPKFKTAYDQYLQIRDIHVDPNKLLRDAAKEGDIEFIDYLISIGANKYDEIIIGAISGHQTELLKKYLSLISDKGSYLFSILLNFAASLGFLDIVEILLLMYLERGGTTLINPVESAVKNDHLEVVKYFVSRYPGLLYTAARQAALSGKLELIKYLLQNYSFSKDELLEFTDLAYDHEDVNRYLRNLVKAK